MPVSFYMDEHIPRAITDGVRMAGVDALTVQDDGRAELPDDEVLDRAMQLGRILFSQDDDLLREATARQIVGKPFGGVIYIHQLRTLIGPVIADLVLIALADDAAAWPNRVEYLPLR